MLTTKNLGLKTIYPKYPHILRTLSPYLVSIEQPHSVNLKGLVLINEYGFVS